MILFKNVSQVYQENQVGALNNLSFYLERGGFLFINGESGSGKSTIIKLLLKEIEPTKGEIWVNGKNVSEINRKRIPEYRQEIGIVFQDFCLLKDKNVYENVALAQFIAGKTGRNMERQVTSILSVMGLIHKCRAYPRELSGGEQQKVCLARAIVNQPPILLADEPTGSLDWESAMEIMEILELFHKRGTTVMVVTHDQNIIRRMGHPVLSL